MMEFTKKYRLLSKRFPYGIYYEVDKDMVIVVAVLDLRQKILKFFQKIERLNTSNRNSWIYRKSFSYLIEVVGLDNINDQNVKYGRLQRGGIVDTLEDGANIPYGELLTSKTINSSS